jgi:hypothetical protein
LGAAWAVSRKHVWAGRPVWPPASRSRAAETVPLARAHQEWSSGSGAARTAHSRANSPPAGRCLVVMSEMKVSQEDVRTWLRRRARLRRRLAGGGIDTN